MDTDYAVNGTVSVHAVEAGTFTLPERFFVSPLSDSNARKTVPSLSFLIEHHSPSSAPSLPSHVTRLVFDLGLRRDISSYSAPIRKHVETRQPMTTSPCVVESLAKGGLTPVDIDYVILSHVHWDHIGTPSEFSSSKFIVGHGSLGLLAGSLKLENGSHSHFEADLLPKGRTIELTNPDIPATPPLSDDEGFMLSDVLVGSKSKRADVDFRTWRSFSVFPQAIDVFGDGSLYIINAPGHLPGHINLLCRISLEPIKYVLLGGDSCHDRRLLTGEKDIAEWEDDKIPGVTQCIHVDKSLAKQTMRRIWDVEKGNIEELGRVEVVFSHDPVWEAKAKEAGRFFPGRL